MNKAIYTKKGELRKIAPPQYRIASTKQPVPEKKLQYNKLPGITFVVGPNGERLEDNPDYKEWLKAREEVTG